MSATVHAIGSFLFAKTGRPASRLVPLGFFAIFSVLLAGALGLRSWQRSPEARAIALVESLGGVYIRDSSKPTLPIVGIDLQATLIDDAGRVHWRGPATDQSLIVLDVFPDLRVLSLVDSSVTDKGLPHLTRLRSLRMLDLRGTRVTDEGVARLRAAMPGVLVVHGPAANARPANWRASL
jgi:hypothetical protein